MKKFLLFQLITIINFFILSNSFATNYYVSTSGLNSNNGTSAPFLTVAYAVSKATSAGDTIFVHEGTYTVTARINLTKSGTSSSRICLFKCKGEARPTLDFSSMPIGSSNQGVMLTGSYWHIYGIRIKGAGDNGMQINGSSCAYNIIEYCDFTENRDAGCQLKNGTHDNKIINCDAYYNADYVSGDSNYTGGNADGFAPKLDIGTGNYFYGCRSWLNSDDGWDGLLYGDYNITTTLENCWTWKNGYLKDGTTTTSDMNGNGFKLGGGWNTLTDGTKSYVFRHNMTLKRCLAFDNKGKGFDQNHDKGTIILYNCTGFGNTSYNYSIAESLLSGCTLTVKNCVSYESSKVTLLSSADTSRNSWKLQNFTISSSDFTSVDTTGISGARNSDGSLPTVAFMHLASTSKMVDAGVKVGLDYYGNNPDLGCYETTCSSCTTKSLTVSAGSNGSVSPSGTYSYNVGTTVPVTATANTGYSFSNFTSSSTAISTSNPYYIKLTADTSITANFAVKYYTLTTTAGTGGTISPSGSNSYAYGTSVSISATASTDYTFSNFTSGSTTLGSSSPLSVTIISDTSVTANFTSTAGLEDISSNNNCKLYSDGEGNYVLSFNTTGTEIVSADIYNLNGILISKPVIESQVSGQQKLSFSLNNVSKGLYICKVKIGQETINLKFIK